jgi:hypothetical protein
MFLISYYDSLYLLSFSSSSNYQSKTHKTMDTRCRHYAREKPPSRGKPSQKFFLSIVFFETLHPRQRPNLPSTPSQPPRSSTSFQQLRLCSSFRHQATSGINQKTWKTSISQSRARNKERESTKISIFFFSLDSTQLALPLASRLQTSHFSQLP